MLYQMIGVAVIVFGVIALLYKLESQGRKAEQNDQMKQVLDDIHTADRARDHLRDDDAAARRVRERFMR